MIVVLKKITSEIWFAIQRHMVAEVGHIPHTIRPLPATNNAFG